ncbi:mucin-5AC [Eurytemora carolleeae]|uniref:mucin-5AC n=1 Tax=Eurytemora carolleeae TaxID=1294199 RepID=UPI000C7730E6|nr:mucin-5AC [Eurytemora carolleeae]|eukprot:XP_023341870.1 mucin-5AC-like [Eurytemora affinis]
MKLKAINRIKGTKKEKKNGKTVRATCPTASCVSNQTTALALELTVVRNFLAQYNRISKKLSLMKNKFLKKDARNGTAGYLADRIGSSMDRNGPLCNGDFNNTEALSAYELLTELNTCDSTIGTICGTYTTVPEATLAELDVCAQTMSVYQDKSKECGTAATNCKCWEEMIVLSQSVKACNKAKDVEDGFKSDYNGCKSSFTSCSKLEDKAPTLMQKCYTSPEKQMILIKTYLEILDSTDKVSTTVDAIISSSNKELAARRKRQTSSSKPCKDFLTAVSAFLTVLSGSNLDGKSPEVSNLGKSVVGMVVEVCSVSEIASLQTSKTSLTASRKKVSERLDKIQSVIQALTQTTVSVSSVVLATFPIPDKLGVVQPTTTAQTTASTGPTTSAKGTTTAAQNPTTTAPGPTTEAPGLSTAAPGPNTVATGPTTAAVGPTTTAPGQTSAASGPTTAAPGPTTAAPGPTTAAPGPTTAAPGPTTAAPGPTTAAPGPTTAAPGQTTAAPGPTTGTPSPSTTTVANLTTTTAVVTELAMPVKVVFSLVSVTMVG